MQRRKQIWVAVAMLMSGIAFSAAPPLEMIPKQADVVIGVNARQIIDSNVFQTRVASTPQVQAMIPVLENLLGTNFLKDINYITFFGRMNDKKAGGMILDGKFDPQKVVAILKTSPKYQTETIAGQTVHEWWDQKEKRMKYGTMLPNGMALVANSKEEMEAALGAAADKAQSVAGTPEASWITDNAAKSTIVATAVNREQKGAAEKYALNSLLLTLNLDASDITAYLSITPRSQDDVAKWLDVLRGAKAWGQLQPEKQNLRTAAAGAVVDQSSDLKSATMSASMPVSEIK